MMTWINSFRNSFSKLQPAIWFGIGLTLFSIAFISTKVQPPSIFCSVDELTLISCTRNWINALGNVFVVIIAIIAARLAFRQWKAADNQASIAIIPSLDDRLNKIYEAYKFGERAKSLLSRLSFDVSSLYARTIDNMSLDNIVVNISSINGKLIDIDKLTHLINDYIEDIRVDDDISEYVMIIQGHLIFSLNKDIRGVVRYVKDFSKLDGDARKAIAAVELKQDRDQLARCTAALSKAADGVVLAKIDIQRLAQTVKNRKLQIMDINVR